MPVGPRVSASFQYVFLKLTCGQGVSKIGGCDRRTLVGRLPRGGGGGGLGEDGTRYSVAWGQIQV